MYFLFLRYNQNCLGLPTIRLAGYREVNCSSLKDYEDMKDVRDCKKFADEADLPFGSGEFDRKVPKGCYWYKWYQKPTSSRYGHLKTSGKWEVTINFNFHHTGGIDKETSPICIKKKGRLLCPQGFTFHAIFYII